MIKYGSAQHGDCPMVHLQEEVLKRNFCTPQRGLLYSPTERLTGLNSWARLWVRTRRNPAKNPFDCLHLKRRLLYDCSSVVRVLCVCVFCKCIVQILTAVCFIRAILTVGVSITALPVGDAVGGALTLELTPAAAIGGMRVLSGYQGRSHRAINCCQENEKHCYSALFPVI